MKQKQKLKLLSLGLAMTGLVTTTNIASFDASQIEGSEITNATLAVNNDINDSIVTSEIEGSETIAVTAEENTANTDSVLTNDVETSNADNEATTTAGSEEGNDSTRIRYMENVNFSMHQEPLTYGQVFDIMDIEFISNNGIKLDANDLVGYSTSTNPAGNSEPMTYDEISKQYVDINWGHTDKYSVSLQFDNSKYDVDGSRPYEYQDFTITIVDENVMNKTYTENYGGEGNELITTWNNGNKESAILRDSNGRVKTKYTYFDNSRIETRSDYNTSNQMIKRTYYTNNADHTLSKVYKYTKPGTSGYFTRYEYDHGIKSHAYAYENNQRVSSYTYYTSGSAKGDVHYKYYWKTSNGKSIKTQIQTRDTAGRLVENRYYDSNGKITKLYKYTKPGTSGYFVRYEYENGVKTRAYTYENNKRIYSFNYFTSGSAKGKVHYKYFWKTSHGNLVKTKRIEYATNGKQKAVIYY